MMTSPGKDGVKDEEGVDGGCYFGPSRDITNLEQCLFKEFRSRFSDIADDILGEHIVPTAVDEHHPHQRHSFRQRTRISLKSAAKIAGRMNALHKSVTPPMENAPEEIPVGPQTTEELKTRESYKMYEYLGGMPECVKSMEDGRKFSPEDGLPLKDRIVFTMHHLDGKSLGGFAVLREWGAKTMYSVFVGYNPAVIPGYFEDIDDIPIEEFQATILVPKKPELGAGEGLTAEATYSLPDDNNLLRCKPPLPKKTLNEAFMTGGMNEKPMVFLEANRCMAGFLFLRALAEAIQTKQKVIIFEDGGYLNSLLDAAIDRISNLSIAQFRAKHGIPPEPLTDEKIGHFQLADAILEGFVGTCELTRNGYNATMALYENRAVTSNRGYLNTRFMSIAVSYNKCNHEGNNIALACMNGIKQVLYSIGWSVSRRNVCVFGSRGNLGRVFCKYLANIVVPTASPATSGTSRSAFKSSLWGVDVKCSWGKSKSDDTPFWGDPWDKPLDGVAGECACYKDIPKEERLNFDVIFGWTGGPMRNIKDGKINGTYDGEDLAEWLVEGKKPVLFFASGSTKTAEFKDVLLYLTELVQTPADRRAVVHESRRVPVVLRVEPIPDDLTLAAVHSAGLDNTKISRNFGYQFAFTLRLGVKSVTKVVYLINKTMPINFLFYGTATEIMDGTFAQVTSATAKLNSMYNEGNLLPGAYPVDYDKKCSDGVYLSFDLDKDYKPPLSSGIPIVATTKGHSE